MEFSFSEFMILKRLLEIRLLVLKQDLIDYPTIYKGNEIEINDVEELLNKIIEILAEIDER